MSNEFRTIHVAAAITPESSGAFEWRTTEAEAMEALATIVAPGDDTRVRAMQVPADLSDDAIIDYIEADDWEPAIDERVKPLHNPAIRNVRTADWRDDA